MHTSGISGYTGWTSSSLLSIISVSFSIWRILANSVKGVGMYSTDGTIGATGTGTAPAVGADGKEVVKWGLVGLE